MSLKEDYSGICSGGIDADMALVFQAGIDLVIVGTAEIIGTAATAVIHQNDLEGGTTPGDVAIIADAVGVAGNAISFTGDGVKTITVLGGENGFSVVSGDATQILELGDVITLSGGVDTIPSSQSGNVALSTGLDAAASAGNTVFTITVLTGFEAENLRLDGIHQQTYFAGIIHALALEGIYSPYVSLLLNVSDTVDTSVDFNFTF